MKKEKFPVELVAQRTKKGLTQAELADAIGVSERSVNLWERGKVTPRAGLRITLAQYFLGNENQEAFLFDDELEPSEPTQSVSVPQSKAVPANVAELMRQLQDTLNNASVSDDVKKSVQSALDSIPQIIEK